MSPTRSLAVAASCIALLLGGCSTSTRASKSEGTTATSTPSTTVASDSSEPTLPTETSGHHRVAETPESRALARKLVASIDGYALQPDSVGDTGPSDLEKTVDDAGGDSDVRTALVEGGFIVGYQRYFVNAAQDRGIAVFAYQFGGPAGARAFADAALQAGLAPQDGVTPTPLPTPSIPDASGVESTSEGVTSRMVIFVKGDYVGMVLVNAREGDTDAPTVFDVAKQQYALL